MYKKKKKKKLFSKVNEELASINQWFTSKKPSLNAKKYSFFPKHSKKDGIPLIMLLRDKNLSNFSEYYYMKT